MNLPEYIKQVGTAAFVKQVGCSPSAAAMYRRQERIPSRKFAQIIVERTPLTWEEIYESNHKAS